MDRSPQVLGDPNGFLRVGKRRAPGAGSIAEVGADRQRLDQDSRHSAAACRADHRVEQPPRTLMLLGPDQRVRDVFTAHRIRS